MPRKSRLSDLKVLSEISNTPLIDLSMLLLVTFLITYPLMQEQAMHINLPVGKTQAIEPQKSHSVSIDREGQVFFDNKPVSTGQLAERMLDLFKTDPQSTIYLRADKDLRYGRVVDIMRILHDANITRMALVTQAD
ncbi:MAG: biopolymer transporter ExbD [Lentisphaerae bacterium]|nr:biopolymer transporter ExbD [Lentisphaerota bacterium]